jgi:invasion protein IalB
MGLRLRGDFLNAEGLRRSRYGLFFVLAWLLIAGLVASGWAQSSPDQNTASPPAPPSPATQPALPSPAGSASVEAPSALSVPLQKITRFDDWELICPKTAAAALKPPKNSCKVSQRLAVKDTNETAFLVSILPAAQPGQVVAIFSAPLGGYLVPGMELRVDRGKAVRVLFETCNAGGCHGGFAFAGPIRASMTAGAQAQIRLWTTKAKTIEIAVSLKGLGPAVKALEEASKS